MDTEPLTLQPSPQTGFERPPALGSLPVASATYSAQARSRPQAARHACGYGKVILLGEHAVVYGTHAIAAPIPLAMRATVRETAAREGGSLCITCTDVARNQAEISTDPQSIPQQAVQLIVSRLGLAERALQIQVSSTIPRAMGLGSSAAFAVAVIRALDGQFNLALDDAQVNILAFGCEELAHGTPSGIDNTVATYGELVLYQRGEEPRKVSQIQPLTIARSLPLVIGVSGCRSSTAEAVAQVRRAWQHQRARYEDIFRHIDDIVLQGVQALRDTDLPRLGALMNACHSHLKALQVSSRELDDLVDIARRNGALGAKLTGGGKGGSMIALCPENRERVANAMREAGYQALNIDLG